MRLAVVAALLFACGGPQLKEPASDKLKENAPATLETERPREGEPHTMKVRVYADPGVRALPRWKDEITDQIDYASQLLRPLIGAELAIDKVEDWARAGDPAKALAELQQQDAGDGVTWVIGYVAPSDTATKVMSDLGASEPMGKHVIVRAWSEAGESRALATTLPDLKETERTELLAAHRRHKQTVVLLHHLALALGGIAESDPTWILHPAYSPKQAGFAEKTRELLTLSGDARVAGEKPQDIARKLLDTIDKAEWGGWIPVQKEQTVSVLRALVQAGQLGKVASDIPPAALDQVGRIKQLAKQGDQTNALAELDNLLAAYPATASLHQLKCDLHLGGVAAAAKATSKPPVLDDKTRAACKRVSELAPGDPGPHLAIGELLATGGDLKAARTELLLAEPKLANLPDKKAAEAAWRRLVGIYQELGALTWTDEVIAKAQLDKDPIAVSVAQTRARYGVPRGTKLVAPEQEALLVKTVKQALAEVYASKYGEAERTLATGERKWPGAPGLAAARCDLALRRGQIVPARAACSKALATDPNASWALYLSGVLALKDASGTKTGVDFLKRAIAVDGELGQAWRTLAKAYTRAGDRAAYEALATEYQTKFGQPLPP